MAGDQVAAAVKDNEVFTLDQKPRETKEGFYKWTWDKSNVDGDETGNQSRVCSSDSGKIVGDHCPL